MANNPISNPNYNPLLSLINIPIQIDIHEHPLILCFTPERKIYGGSWSCNNCFNNYTYQIPYFYCTFCDFDLCSNCLGNYKLNNIKAYDRTKNSYISKIQINPNNVFKWKKIYSSHMHLLTLIKKINPNFSWKCDNCSQNYNNDNQSYYCSLCDFDICEICMNNNNNIIINNINNNMMNNNNIYNNNIIVKSLTNNQNHQNTFFQIKSFQKLNEEYKNQNLLYCPLPVQLLFTLLANGINPENALNELTNSFLIMDLNEENNYYIKLLASLFNYSSLNMANTIYCTFQPTSQFQSWLQRYLTAMSKNKNDLNNFIYEKTKYKIQNYFTDQDLFNADMILTNVLYFKSFWRKKFDPYSQDYFYNSKGQTKFVNMMKCKDYFKYYKNNSIEVI